MSGENSCFSRFLVKFVEVSAAGLATAISAYTSVAEKEPRGQTSAEALARAALANVDANRPAPHDALIEPGLADTRSAPVDIQPRPADVPPRQADVGPPPPVAVPPR